MPLPSGGGDRRVPRHHAALQALLVEPLQSVQPRHGGQTALGFKDVGPLGSRV